MTHGWLAELIARERLPTSYAEEVERWQRPLAQRLAGWAEERPGVLVGVCAPQASGKTTLCAVLERLLEEQGVRAVTLSLDDLYLPLAERQLLAVEVHPLLATRGVPGTHDTALGHTLIDGLLPRAAVTLPRFDKAADDRAPAGEGRQVDGPVDLILFEGWCVGCRPQPPDALESPVNGLEHDEDADAVWRTFVNTQLSEVYAELFGRLDRLVLLRPPGFEVVAGWRREQERKLRERLARYGVGAGRAMTDAEVDRFVAHYERLTRWILNDLPSRADVVVALDGDRRGMLLS